MKKPTKKEFLDFLQDTDKEYPPSIMAAVLNQELAKSKAHFAELLLKVYEITFEYSAKPLKERVLVEFDPISRIKNFCSIAYKEPNLPIEIAYDLYAAYLFYNKIAKLDLGRVFAAEKIADLNFITLIRKLMDDKYKAVDTKHKSDLATKGGKATLKKKRSRKDEREEIFLEFYQRTTDSQPRLKKLKASFWTPEFIKYMKENHIKLTVRESTIEKEVPKILKKGT